MHSSTRFGCGPTSTTRCARIPLEGATAETRYYIERELRDFRLAGVDKPAPVRERVGQLRSQLTAAMNEFQRHIREGGRKVVVRESGRTRGSAGGLHRPPSSRRQWRHHALDRCRRRASGPPLRGQR
jgi:hypothetical protein